MNVRFRDSHLMSFMRKSLISYPRVMNSKPENFLACLRVRAWWIKRDVLALHLAARDLRVPRHAKLVAAVVAVYALSPIDLIPDFISILGHNAS